MSAAGLEHALRVLRGHRHGGLAVADLAVMVLAATVLVRSEFLRVSRRLRSRAWAGRVLLAVPGFILLLGLVVLRRMVDY